MCARTSIDLGLRRRDGEVEEWAPAEEGWAIEMEPGQVPEEFLAFWVTDTVDGDVLDDMRLQGYDGPPPSEVAPIEWAVADDVCDRLRPAAG